MSLVTVAPYGRGAASARARVYQWLDRTAVEVDVHSYTDQATSSPRLLLRHPARLTAAERRLRQLERSRPTTLMLHREASPLSRGHLEERLLRCADLAVYDFDDALQWDHGTDSLQRRLIPKAAKCVRAARAADRVIAGNELLATWASEYCADVTVIPTCVEPEDYPRRLSYELHDPPTIGWMGTPSTEKFLPPIADALRAVHRETGCLLLVVSGPRDAGALGLGPFVRRVPWSPRGMADALARIDVAIAPMADTMQARGKCAYKLLQYGAAAIPAVASPVGVNGGVVETLGYLSAATGTDWADALRALLASRARRERMGQQARVAVERHYSYAAWESVWSDRLGLIKRGEER